MSFYHQDWTPVVFTKKTEQDTKEKKVIVQKSKLDDNRESFEHKKIPKHVADAIKNKRIEMKMTQEQLAKSINERPSVVNDVEAMRGVYEHVKINKILRVLGLTLKEILTQK